MILNEICSYMFFSYNSLQENNKNNNLKNEKNEKCMDFL